MSAKNTHAVNPDIEGVDSGLLSRVKSGGGVGGISDERIDGVGHLTKLRPQRSDKSCGHLSYKNELTVQDCPSGPSA